MAKASKDFKPQIAGEGGWCDWVSPTPKAPYQMACCDCGLVHDLEFRAVEITSTSRNGWWKSKPLEVAYRVLFRARRNVRSTAKLRAEDAAVAAADSGFNLGKAAE